MQLSSNYLKIISYLPSRIQLLFPFDFLGMVSRFDVEATVTGGGHAGQATAIRHAISLALARHFVDPHRAEQMRQGKSVLYNKELTLKSRDRIGGGGGGKED